VRIATASGATLLLADFEPAAFIDIWDRATASAGGDADAGAMYQSVLTNLRWSDVASSPFLTALKAAASDGLLSIKFNVDGFNLDYTSPQFMTGRIVGTLGPASADEPKHFVVGRQFMAANNAYQLPPAGFFQPSANINFCVGRVDANAGLLYLDLGNALLTGVGGSILSLGDLQVQVFVSQAGRAFTIGTLPAEGAGGYSSDPDWYPRTAGVVSLPIPARLRAVVQSNPLCIVGALGRINEAPGGGFVRADTYVFRASPGDTVSIDVRASVFGQPLANAVVDFAADASQLQPGNYVDANDVPPVATPLSAIGFADQGTTLSATTDSTGKAILTLTMGNPGTPRWFNGGSDYGIDGQVYGIRASLQNGDDAGPVNPWNFTSILLWSAYVEPATPTWADVQPIFQQYANLYPVMNRFLDMGNYGSVVAHTRLLTLAFGLDPSDPNAMPVTRDLSPAKRATILAWLADPRPAPAPTASAPAPATAPAPAADAALKTTAAEADTEDAAPRSGKASAAARRLFLQTPAQRD
jgi:hypothetical protein